jgi:hypothetical protein
LYTKQKLYNKILINFQKKEEVKCDFLHWKMGKSYAPKSRRDELMKKHHLTIYTGGLEEHIVVLKH